MIVTCTMYLLSLFPLDFVSQGCIENEAFTTHPQIVAHGLNVKNMPLGLLGSPSERLRISVSFDRLVQRS